MHCTVNGLGERAGNASLSSAVAVIHDMLHMSTGIDESKINRVSHIIESYSGVAIPPNKPIVGEYVFTQCAGVHADGDSASAAPANMPSANYRAKPISARILKLSDLT